MIKFAGDKKIKHHVIRFEEWPMDCLVRYLEKSKQLLLRTTAPKIITLICSLNAIETNSSASIRQVDVLFTSSLNRVAIQMRKEDQNLLPYVNHLIVSMERNLPFNTNAFSVVYDCIERIKQDYLAQKRIFDQIYMAFHDNRSKTQTVFYSQLFLEIRKFEKELFHILDLQRRVLFPKICLMTSKL